MTDPQNRNFLVLLDFLQTSLSWPRYDATKLAEHLLIAAEKGIGWRDWQTDPPKRTDCPIVAYDRHGNVHNATMYVGHQTTWACGWQSLRIFAQQELDARGRAAAANHRDKLSRSIEDTARLVPRHDLTSGQDGPSIGAQEPSAEPELPPADVTVRQDSAVEGPFDIRVFLRGGGSFLVTGVRKLGTRSSARTGRITHIELQQRGADTDHMLVLQALDLGEVVAIVRLPDQLNRDD